MNLDTATLLTFGLLIASFCCCWIDSVERHSKYGFTFTISLFFLSVCSGMYFHLLHSPAVLALISLAVLAHLYYKGRLRCWVKQTVFISFVLLTLLLALHKVPGFDNPLLLDHFKFSDDSLPFSMYASYDKAAAGLILLYFVLSDSHVIRISSSTKKIALYLGVANIVVLTVAGLMTGFVRFDIKLPAFGVVFLILNFFLTCVAEEIFFRGVLQTKIAALTSHRADGTWLAALISAALFGLAHFGGGWLYVLLATLAGIFYSAGYMLSRKIEVSVLLHFSFNAFQFLILSRLLKYCFRRRSGQVVPSENELYGVFLYSRMVKVPLKLNAREVFQQPVSYQALGRG